MNNLLDCVEIETAPNPSHSIIWMHGLGADANDFVPILPELNLPSNMAVRFVFPNAPVIPITINNGYKMPGWYDIFEMTLDPERKEDSIGIRHSEQQIKALIERENQRGIATENIFLAGFSQGCAMTLHTGLRYPEKLAGLICLSGYLPLMDSFKQEKNSANQKTPILLIHGTYDPVVKIERAIISKELLEAQQYSVQWHTYPMEHSLCLEEVENISAFIQKQINHA